MRTFFAHGYLRRRVVFSGGWIQFYRHIFYIRERSPVRDKRLFKRHKGDRVIMSKTVKVSDQTYERLHKFIEKMYPQTYIAYTGRYARFYYWMSFDEALNDSLDHPHAGFHKYLPEGEVNDA